MFQCDNCGEIKIALVDGYAFGDTLLEGVMFEISKDDDGMYHAKVADEYKDYMADLNEAKWLNEAMKYVSETDVLTCPRCGMDVGASQRD